MGGNGARAETPLLTVLKRSRPSIACLRPCQRGSPRIVSAAAPDSVPDAAPGEDRGAVAEALRPALRRLGLIESAEPFGLTPLTGGVASDIWMVEAPRRRFVVKRALEK